MGTADSRRNRKGFAGFKGGQNRLAGGNFPPECPRQKILSQAAKPSEIHALAAMAKKPRSRVQGLESFMSQLIERHPTAAIWLFAGLQGAAMLGLNVLLRALVS